MAGKKKVAGRNQVKERILRAAADLFMERGFAGTSVREIGQLAGVGQSSLYHHAHSKGRLLSELHASHAIELTARLEQIVESKKPPTAQLRGLIATILEIVHTHHAVATVYLRERYALSDKARRQVRRERHKIYSIVDRTLQSGVKSGEFRPDLNIPLTRLAILGMCNWTYQWYHFDGAQTMIEISEIFAELAEAAVIKRASG